MSILRTESLTGLWRGTAPTLLRNVPGSAGYFYTLQLMRSKMNSSSSYSSFFEKYDRGLINLISGASARTVKNLRF